jgi:hypothetical protein
LIPISTGDLQHKGNHHQTYDVVDEEGRKQAAQEDDSGQQVMWLQPGNHYFRNPIEEARQMQVGHHKHHREEQDDGAEMDEM